MSLDWAAKNFEFNPALGIHGQNAGHRRVGILTANRDITACYRDKSDACVNQSGPYPTISRHVHEINRKVIRHRDHSSSLLIPPARRVRNRVVETAVEPSDGQLRNVRKHDREMRTVEGCHQSESRQMKPTKRRETNLSIGSKSITHLARFQHRLFQDRLDRDAQNAVQVESSLRRLVDTRGSHYSGPNHYDRVIGYPLTTNHQGLDHQP